MMDLYWHQVINTTGNVAETDEENPYFAAANTERRKLLSEIAVTLLPIAAKSGIGFAQTSNPNALLYGHLVTRLAEDPRYDPHYGALFDAVMPSDFRNDDVFDWQRLGRVLSASRLRVYLEDLIEEGFARAVPEATLSILRDQLDRAVAMPRPPSATVCPDLVRIHHLKIQ